ncbi:ParB/RepB/Spo0J family partition protein [Agathobaculum hominis]|uniref:ParB N-terminal domain-containing protein n=2 Tax=Agathobaculum TaxID=2048137 RepID=A0ABR7GJU8_9FIRM|nr:ParB N-terminal domain-containing protein [Agathobaculum hominis]MBC5694587.1 ParB N-terminal domain-containing protein [Agathobaculum hominis]
MAKSALANALKERSAKSATQSADVNDSVDEAFEALFGAAAPPAKKKRVTMELPIEQLHPFRTSHIGFKPYSQENLKMLADDIAENGLIENIKVRPSEHGYEILSGHNRVAACKMLGRKEITADIEFVDNARAVVIATVTNLQRRQSLLPSERGWAYRALLDAYRSQGKRNDLVSATSGEFHPRLSARERVACFFGVGVSDVRYSVRLTYLIQKLLDEIDARKLNMMCGVALSYYDSTTQGRFYHLLKAEHRRLSVDVMKKIKQSCPPPSISAEELDKAWKTAAEQLSEQKTDSIRFSRKRFEPYLHRIPPDINIEDLFLEFLQNRFADGEQP